MPSEVTQRVPRGASTRATPTWARVPAQVPSEAPEHVLEAHDHDDCDGLARSL